MFSYRAVLKKAFEVVWGHKYLWFFGFFATFLATGGHFNLAFGKVHQALFQERVLFDFAKVFDAKFISTDILINFGSAFQKDPTSAFTAMVFLLVFLVLIAFFCWLVVVSEISLINNSAITIKKNKKTTIKEGVDAGIANFWSVLGVNLMGKLFVLFLLAFVSLPLIFLSHQSNPVQDLLYMLLFLVFLPIALIISFIVRYASSYMVLRKKKFVEAMENAWNLFLNNWVVSIESAFIILFINAVVCLGVFLLVLILATPYLLLSYILAAFLASIIMPAATFSLMLSIGIVLAVFLVVIIGSALTSFRTIAWTNVFLELDSKHPTLSKLVRIFG